MLKKIIKKLTPTDFLVIVFGIILSFINIIYSKQIPNWERHLLFNTLTILIVVLIAIKDNSKYSILWKQLHYWYLVPLIFLCFKELYYMIEPIRGKIYDDILIKIDRAIFGCDPTIELYKISNPLLTEILQIVYGTFFFLPIILGIDFILNNKFEEFQNGTFLIVYGFFLSFIGYLIIPAIGPRFTLHNFDTNNIEMPGLLLTNFLREIVNSGESIPAGTPNPSLLVQRDAFPSGHTEITLIVMYLSVKYNSRLKKFFIINGSLLIFATVYLRYHYVIDLIGGALFMIFTIWSGKYIFLWWERIRR
ncbi:phosphatase PAP2 family protein [Melioribacteraceae bacterium 4301-Me]|uniref:phosphatase PAP2 family protein n=1 Tax=Pyranulibacter aquaticus TaxID=3163344 RepID=UPI003597B9CB